MFSELWLYYNFQTAGDLQGAAHVIVFRVRYYSPFLWLHKMAEGWDFIVGNLKYLYVLANNCITYIHTALW